MICKTCGSEAVDVLYSLPCQYRCQNCGLRWAGAGIPTLTAEEAKSKRPAMYGLPACDCCGHEPHPNTSCRWCAKDRA